MYESLLIINLATSLFMTGVIWFVQVVHYPLFGKVGVVDFSVYETAHTRLTTFIVGPPMLLETVTSLLLVRFCPIESVVIWLWIGLLLQLVLWLSTIFIQVPCHRQLEKGFNAEVHRRLVSSNWLRTIVWTLRSLLLLFLLYQSLA
jgi:uncharacterized membrane protein